MMDEIKNFILTKTEKNDQRFRDLFPHRTQNGIYNLLEHCSWIGGFYPGLNYMCYEMSKDKKFIELARVPMQRLKNDLDTRGASLGHDIGFLFSLSSYADYLLTGNEEAKQTTIQAGDTLMQRFKPNGGYIQAWDVHLGELEEHADFFAENGTRMIIDCMYNLPLLFRCSELTGDKKYYDAAYTHAKTAQKYLVRDDYTTAHTFVFNEDGTPRYQRTWQGYADDSCWSRGQAWAVTGFAMAYKFTKDESFLETSKNCAKVFIDRLEDDMVPKWDLIFQHQKDVPTDTSAAGIAACGLMDLFDVTGDEYYKDTATKMLLSLYENYSSKDQPDNEGLINGATGHKPLEVDVNCSLIYGDYYFAELLARLTGCTKTFW